MVGWSCVCSPGSAYTRQPAMDSKATGQALAIIMVKSAAAHLECRKACVGLESLTKSLTTALDIVVADTVARVIAQQLSKAHDEVLGMCKLTPNLSARYGPRQAQAPLRPLARAHCASN